jgi:DNA-binding MarR family transcriptional regulator
MIYKLVDKNLVEKHVSPESDAAVSLFLTDKGRQARAEHQKMHEDQRKLFASLMNSLSDEALDSMIKFIKEFEKEVDEILSKS